MIQVKIPDVDRLHIAEVYRQTPKLVYAAARTTLRRTITKTKKLIAINTRKVYQVKSSYVKAALTVEAPKGGNLVAAVRATGKSVKLAGFQVTFSRKRLPVKVRVKKSSPLKPVKGLFRNDFPSGYSGLMHRRQPTRYPLKTPAGPSVPQMVEKPQIFTSVEQEAERYMAQTFLHEVDFRVWRAAHKAASKGG